MKTIYILLIICIFLFKINKNIHAQVVAIGHICAEVIESASIGSLAITDLVINHDSTNFVVNMGKVTINSSSNVITNILVNKTTITNGQQTFEITPSTDSTINGSKTIDITGTTNLTSDVSGDYQGLYAMTIVYN